MRPARGWLVLVALAVPACSSSGDAIGETRPGGAGGDSSEGGSSSGSAGDHAGTSGSATGGSSTASAQAGGSSGAADSVPSGGFSGAVGGTTSMSGSGGAFGGSSDAGGAPSGAGACIFHSVPCTQAEHDADVANALQQPLVPPRYVGGLDLFRGSVIDGPSMTDIAHGYLRADYGTPAITYPGGCVQICPTPGQGPLDDAKVLGVFEKTDFFGPDLSLAGSYSGSMIMATPPGGPWGDHTWVATMGKPLVRDGVAQTLSFVSSNVSAPTDWPNELFAAIAYTFAPYLPPPDSTTSCIAAGSCSVGTVDSLGYFSPKGLPAAIWFGDPNQGLAAASTVVDFELPGPWKHMAIEGASASLRISESGPSVHATKLGFAQSACMVGIGSTFGAFRSSCVDVTSSSLGDAHEEEKLGLGRSTEENRFALDLPWISIGVHANEIGPGGLVTSGDMPSDADPIDSISVVPSSWIPATLLDQDTDSSGDEDDHGIGLVYLELARLVEDSLQASRSDICADPTSCPDGEAPRRVLADAACLNPKAKQLPDGSPILAQGCTGMENFVTPAPDTIEGSSDQPRLGFLALGKSFEMTTGASVNFLGTTSAGGYGLQAAFCAELADHAGAECDFAHGAGTGNIFAFVARRLTDVFAGGDPSKMPVEARDSAFVARLLATAFFRELIAEGQGNVTAGAVHAADVQPHDLEVTAVPSVGTFPGQRVTYHYVDHTLASASTPPLTASVTFDLPTDAIVSYRFDRFFSRGERALYAAVASPSAILGGLLGDDVAFTSVFGSKVLDGVWGSSPSCAVTASASCAHGPPLDASGKLALDERGKPLLTRYAPSIALPPPLALGDVAASLGSQIENTVGGVTTGYIPVSFGSAAPALVPFLPHDGTTGLDVIDGSGADQILSYDQLRFAGSTLDLDVAISPGTTTSSTRFVGVTARRFEGLAFLCFDPSSDSLLSIASGDRAEVVTEWIAAHADAATACELVVHEDANGVVDRVGSRKEGVSVRFFASPGPRASEVATWDPSLTP